MASTRKYSLAILRPPTTLIISSLKLLKSLRASGIVVQKILDKAEADKPDQTFLVGTAHSVKGLEFGTVFISDVLNSYVFKAIDTARVNPTVQEYADDKIEACKLYYVACSRSMHTLHNAEILDYY